MVQREMAQKGAVSGEPAYTVVSIEKWGDASISNPEYPHFYRVGFIWHNQADEVRYTYVDGNDELDALVRFRKRWGKL
jgi:hypothetical protein